MIEDQAYINYYAVDRQRIQVLRAKNGDLSSISAFLYRDGVGCRYEKIYPWVQVGTRRICPSPRMSASRR
jgi:hypothetical protein